MLSNLLLKRDGLFFCFSLYSSDMSYVNVRSIYIVLSCIHRTDFPESCQMNTRCTRMLHQKCTRGLYPASNIKRFEVPEEKISWTVEYPEYKPVAYTAAVLQGKPWADPDINEPTFKPRWNAIDGNYPLDLFPCLNSEQLS